MIFGIGLPKTGTSSLHRALCDLKLRSVHYPIDDVIPSLQVGAYSSIASGRQAMANCGEWHFAALDREFPGSRFICTWREFDDWIVSVQKHFDRYDHPKPGEAAFHNRLEVFGITVFDRDVMETVYWAHRFAVERHFGHREDLLWLNVKDDDAFPKLCEFLGMPRKTARFPHMNRAPA
ncbi:MAG: hypothetical protein H7A11_12660 [Pseudomonadales bacterium]|nr:hypothetical protein [Gammaproteobacteria bacterium]MCB1787994.1 hypothetical protein [Gammaproteobacteria bacterium]MCP5338548.1 hypothetical protein [Pseudomonadales bacterium]